MNRNMLCEMGLRLSRNRKTEEDYILFTISNACEIINEIKNVKFSNEYKIKRVHKA